MLKNMKIGKKLIIAFIAVALVVSLSGFLGLGILTGMNANYSLALVQNGFVQGDIGDYNTYITEGGALVRHIILETDETKIQAAIAELEDVKEKSLVSLEIATKNCQTPDELVFIDRINKALPSYQTGRDKAVALALENKNDEAFSVFCNEVTPYLNECISAGQELMKLNVDMGNKVAAELNAQAKLGMYSIVALVAAGLIIATFFGIFIAKDISKPLDEIEKAAEKMAKGDFDVDITYQARNEIGHLAKSMNEMIVTIKAIILDTSRGLTEIAEGNFDIAPNADYVGVFAAVESSMGKIIMDMSSTMSQIKMSAEQVTSGSEQVSSGSQALAQGATEQASSVQELSASIGEVSEQVKQSAENANSAQVLVENVGVAIMSSNDQMTQMISAMSEINNSSQEIGKIIKTIEDIAFQTNILALNAAVEAARAGEAGKGFAVVADEVRNLATKSSEAAKQTSTLIAGSMQSVSNGVKIADGTAQSLADVVTGAKEITNIIGRISQAAADQANAIAQINLGVEQISSVVQTNSATSEESAAASEELNGQAAMMKQMIEKFKINSALNN